MARWFANDISQIQLFSSVDVNGNIARLEGLETPNSDKAETPKDDDGKTESATIIGDGNPKKRKLDESADGSTATTNAIEKSSTTTDWDSGKAELTKLLGEETSQEVISFLQSNDETSNTKADKKFYTLPLITDKQIRRSIHVLIKSPVLSSVARADNHDGRIRIWHVNFLKDMPADTHVNGRGVGDNRNNINRKNTNGKGGKGESLG